MILPPKPIKVLLPRTTTLIQTQLRFTSKTLRQILKINILLNVLQTTPRVNLNIIYRPLAQKHLYHLIDNLKAKGSIYNKKLLTSLRIVLLTDPNNRHEKMLKLSSEKLHNRDSFEI